MKKDKRENAEVAAALAELEGIRDRLAAARSEFQHSADPMLVEANIHEINALNARYGYLLRRLKEAREQAAQAPRRRGRKRREDMQ